MQLQQDHKASPFQERIAVENFFSGTNFVEIQSDIADAIYSGVPIIVLTGADGSGKSMVCHQLQAQQGGIYETVIFPKTVDSFEDVVTSIALHLELTFGKDENINLDATLEKITALLNGEQISLLLIFDEAENIYLATLERIRKMLDRMNGAGAKLHLLFSGRNNFLGNYEQLSICDFDDVEELHLVTEPLDETETAEYILTSCEKNTEHGAEKIFTQEVIGNIYDVAKGNFRMTNILAEEALQSHTDDNSFMVLLENVKEEVESEQAAIGENTLAGLFDQYKPYLPWGGGLALIGILLFLFMGTDDEQPLEPTERKLVLEIVKPEASEKKKVMPTVVSEKHPLREDLSSKSQSTIEESIVANTPSVASVALQEAEDVDQAIIDDTTTSGNEPTIDEKIIHLQPVAIVEERVAPANDNRAIPAAVDTGSSVERTLEPSMSVLNENQVIAITPTEKKQKLDLNPPARVVASKSIIELRPDLTMKRRPGDNSKQNRPKQLIDAKVEDKEISRGRTNSSSVDQLYRDRVFAGKSWRNGNKDHLFTVQLMVLTSSVAEGNIRRMLSEERYRQEAGNFYIFKNDSDPENVMVFYGEYRTIARARLAQNSLPQFLRDHKPYAISIKGAMAKLVR